MPGVEKVTNTLNISGKPGLLAAFRAKAAELHGERGVSKAACEALRSWLVSKGVDYAEDADASAEATRLKKLTALSVLGVDVDAELERLLETAGQATEAAT